MVGARNIKNGIHELQDKSISDVGIGKTNYSPEHPQAEHRFATQE